ncbi:hypothetical protein F511_00634 [Dorcoceras hygrometricum]|nr:hypothetical protein F511_00634 [Dorcoceras hygrometricum]
MGDLLESLVRQAADVASLDLSDRVDCKTDRKILLALLIELLFMVVIVFITLVSLHGTKQRSMLIGILCIVFNIIMYTSPLTVMVPNGLGSLSGLVQLILYATYYRTTDWDDDGTGNANQPAEIQLQRTNSAAPV